MGKIMTDVAQAYLEDSFRSFRGYRRLAEGAIEQVNDEELFRSLDPESNSIAVIMRHIGGNMRSRWTDFLSSDGEKSWRHRDREFETPPSQARADLMREWDEAWELTLSTLEALQPGDVLREVVIRGDKHTVLWALQRQIAHYAYHVGQIVFLAKHFRGAAWKSLSIPKGMSEEVNRRAAAGEKMDHPLRGGGKW
jgi:uncharacterized damage-inducible protein DinB